ncbi:MAG: hypothetical protein HN416_13720 [Nitrospina sp.]|nr:hypothetical protein [Nitrospina sp.]
MNITPCCIVIFGPYKSGTTGLFYKIRNSLSGTVRTLFEPKQYVPETGDEDRWILAKTILGAGDGPETVHYSDFLGFEKKIYLCRDPRDLMVSGVLFMVQQEPSIYKNDERLARVLTLLRQKEADPESISLCRLFERIVDESDHHSFGQVTEWLGFQYRWLLQFEDDLGDYCRVKYEDFVDGKLESLEAYLGFPLTGEPRVDPIHDHVPRTLAYDNWKNWFVEEDIAFFKPFFDAYIERYKYSENWRPSHKQSISPDHCSRYVMRTVNKRATQFAGSQLEKA